MNRLRLTDGLDAGLIFDMLAKRYSPEKWVKVTQGVDEAEVRRRFISHCRNFPALGFEYDGKPIGGVLFDGKEVHMEFLPEYHGRWALLWPQVLDWLFSMQDPIFVRVEIDNEQIQRFIERNHWERVKVDDEYVTYKWTSEAVAHLLRRVKGRRAQGIPRRAAIDFPVPASTAIGATEKGSA